MDRMSGPPVRFVVVALLLLVAGRAEAQRPPTEGLPLPDRSISTQHDAASLEVNPAGLGFTEAVEFQYNLAFGGGPLSAPFRDQHAGFLSAGNEWIAGGFGFQWLDREVGSRGDVQYQKMSFAGALRPLRSVSLGFGVHLLGSSEHRRLDSLTGVDIGLQWRPSQFLGVGLALKNTNHPYLRPDRSLPVRVQPGAALRLFDGRLVLENQFDLVPRAARVTYRPRMSASIVDGLRLFGRASWDLASAPETTAGSGFGAVGGLDLGFGHIGLSSGTHLASADGGTGFAGQSQSLRLSSRQKSSLIPAPGRWVRVTLDPSLEERSSNSPFTESTRSIFELLLELRSFRRDPSVEGVLVDVRPSSLGYAQAWELRRALDGLSSAGKRTVAFLQDPSFTGSYVASSADRVLLLPSTPYEPEGVSARQQNYGEALARVGIQTEFVRIGEYKSAPEAWVRDTPSREALEQTEAYVDGLYDEVVGAIAEDRDLDDARVDRAVESVPVLPDRARREGFVDDVAYADEVETFLRKEFGARRIESLSDSGSSTPTHGWEGGPVVAVLYVDGSIVRGQSGSTPLVDQMLSGSETLSQAVDELIQSPNVSATVVRIDSPGGSAVASDKIYRDIRRLSQHMPVVASMGNVAASGGYYVASAADHVFATPNTLTGSIGIFAAKFSADSLASRLGIESTSIQRGERSDLFSPFSSWSPPQRERIQESIHYLYELFLHQASKTRPLDASEIDRVARGRVWTGRRAEEHGLVDRLGGLMDAIDLAERRAGLEPGRANYEVYPSRASFPDLPSGVRSKLAAWVEREPNSLLRAVFERILERVGREVLIPLLYESGEPLMLPATPLDVGN